MNWFELSAVFVASVSGNLAGRQKSMDFFGMFMLGAITGIGGGTLRNILLNLPVVALQDGSYVIICIVASIASFLLTPIWDRYRRIVSIIDAFSLGLFCIYGIQIAQKQGYAWWSCLICGVITATFGGVLRDIVRGEIPLIFRKEIYATAAIVGGGFYLCVEYLHALHAPLNAVISISIVTSIRLLAIRYTLHQSE